jgi:hypothetical protein
MGQSVYETALFLESKVTAGLELGFKTEHCKS